MKYTPVSVSLCIHARSTRDANFHKIINSIRLQETDFNRRKHLIESLVSSKIDCCDPAFYPLLDFFFESMSLDVMIET